MSSTALATVKSPWQTFPTELKLMVLEFCIDTQSCVDIGEHISVHLGNLLNIATTNRELHDLVLEMYYGRNIFVGEADSGSFHTTRPRALFLYPNPAIAHRVRRLGIHLELPVCDTSPNDPLPADWSLVVGDRSDWMDHFDTAEFEIVIYLSEGWVCPASQAMTADQVDGDSAEKYVQDLLKGAKVRSKTAKVVVTVDDTERQGTCVAACEPCCTTWWKTAVEGLFKES